MAWNDQQKALWEIARGKLTALNAAFNKHEMLRSGEALSDDPDKASRGERWNMLQVSQSLSFDLACLLGTESKEG